MTLRDDLVEKLETENEELRHRVSELEALVGITFESPPVFGLTRQESVVFGVLMKVKLMTKEAAITALYLHKQDEAQIKIVDVFICKLRSKLKPWNIEILTQWGQGYFMSAESKAVAQRAIEEAAA